MKPKQITKGNRHKTPIMAMAMVLSVIFITSAFMGCLGDDDGLVGGGMKRIVKGLNDLGVTISVPYSIELTETVTWGSSDSKSVTRNVEVTLVLDPAEVGESSEDRAFFNEETVKWWDYDGRVGDYESTYIYGDSLQNKPKDSFAEFKANNLKEVADNCFGNILLSGRDSEEQYAFDTGEWTLVPYKTDGSLNDRAWNESRDVGTTDNMGTPTKVVIDPALMDNADFAEAFQSKFGIPYNSMDFEETRGLSDLTGGRTFLAAIFPSSAQGLSGFIAGGVVPMGANFMFEKTTDYVMTQLKSKVAEKKAYDVPGLAWVEMKVTLTVNVFNQVSTVEFGVPIPILLEPIGKRLEWMDDNGYNAFNKKTKQWTNEECLFSGKFGVYKNFPLSGSVPFFVPFRKILSRSNIFTMSVSGNGMIYSDRFNTGAWQLTEIEEWHDISVGGWDFPILNAVGNGIVKGINWGLEKLEPAIKWVADKITYWKNDAKKVKFDVLEPQPMRADQEFDDIQTSFRVI